MDMQHTDQHGPHRKCYSWSAVLAGAFVGVGLFFLLNLFSVAIGLTAFITDSEGATVLAMGGFIALLIGGIIATFIEGWIAGYLGASPVSAQHHCLGVIYGFSAWTVALIISIFITSHANLFVSSYSRFITNPVVAMVSTNSGVVEKENNAGSTEVVVNADKAAEFFAKSAFAIFALFFIGALSSSFGGYCGHSCKKHHHV